MLKKNNENNELATLQNRINLIRITGSAEVVQALNEYLDSWGSESGEEQNQRYCNLLKVMRVDLGIDKKRNEDFPEIGLRDISIKNGSE